MLYSYGGDFLSGWLWGMRAVPAGAAHAPLSLFSRTFSLRFLHEFFAMARVLSGLTLLGLWTIGKGLFSPGSPRRASFLFLGAWFVCGLALFAAGVRDMAPVALYFYMWRLFLMSACTVCSALALDEVARRRIGLEPFVGVTFGALLLGYFFLHQNNWGGSRSAALFLGGGLLFSAAAAGVLHHLSRTSETRQWIVLAGLIVAYVVADASIGISTIRADDPDWRALNTFHSSLPAETDAGACFSNQREQPAVPAAFGTQIGMAESRRDPGARLGPGARNGASTSDRRPTRPSSSTGATATRGPPILRETSGKRGRWETLSFSRTANCEPTCSSGNTSRPAMRLTPPRKRPACRTRGTSESRAQDPVIWARPCALSQLLLHLLVLRVGLGQLLEQRNGFLIFPLLEIGVRQARRAGMGTGNLIDHVFPDFDGSVDVPLVA